MTLDLSSSYLAEIEAFATELAAHSGEILWRLFPNPLGTPEDLNVRFKDSQKRDPVTRADNEVQDYLVSKIKTAYPDHGVLGEEGEIEDELVPDVVWVLDPLDGTRNFMYGFPVFACSIGVLYKGIPVCGAIFLPWPGVTPGLLIHASKGNGIKINQITIPSIEKKLDGKAIITIPGSFPDMFRFDPVFAKQSGEPRLSGSIAYEMSMVAMGVTQFAVISGGKLWDIAGAFAILSESGCQYRWLNNMADINHPIPIVDWNLSKVFYRDLLVSIPSLVVAPKNMIDSVAEGITKKSLTPGGVVKSFFRFW